MAAAFAKFRVGTPGAGSSHASYITRASALEPDRHRNRGVELDLNRDDNSVAGTLDDHMNDRATDDNKNNDADPVWTWNAPNFLTGDDYGSDESKSSRALSDVTAQDAILTEKMMAGVTSQNDRRRLKEKVANVRAFFGSKEQFEKAKGRQDSLPGNPVVRCPCDQLADSRSHKPVPQRDISKGDCVRSNSP